jgi:ATP-binding cassette subfamily B protein
MRTPPSPPSHSATGGTLVSLRALWLFVSPYRSRLIWALLALLIGSGINLVFPEVVRRGLEPRIFPTVLENTPLFFGLLGALFVIQGGAFFARSLLFGSLGQLVYADVRKKLFVSLLGKEIPFFDHQRSGDLASRLNSDAALVQDLVSVKLSVVLRYGIQVILGTFLMIWMSWQMTAAIVGSVVCMIAVSGACVRSLRTASRRFQSELAGLTAFAAETFAGIKVVRAFGAEKAIDRVFLGMSREVLEAGQGRARVSAGFSSGASLLLNLLLLAVLCFGINLVRHERLPVNDLAAFALYGSIVAVSFAFLVNAYSEVVQGLAGLDRVFELCEAESPRGGTLSEVISLAGPAISFEEVSFAYPSRPDTVVLDKLSLTIAAGSTVGIMGPSGAGKSSIVQLILKFYEGKAGVILVNGVELSAISNKELRSKVAWVPQDPLLFGVSLYENLTLGGVAIARSELETRIQSWGFLDFITELPGGLDMVLGEHGTQLSGGQRQRIAIARAILRNPRLLLLDEATSGLDSILEERVLKVVKTHLPDSTVIIVSHRLSSVRAADSILMINEGRVVEQGSHSELQRAGGLYQHYAERQGLN